MSVELLIERGNEMDTLESLCYYDKRNPEGYYAEYNRWLWEGEETIEPRQESCSCDACFYGRDELAARILELESVLREMTGVYKELVDDAGGCDHSVGICWCTDYWLIERAEKVLGE